MTQIRNIMYKEMNGHYIFFLFSLWKIEKKDQQWEKKEGEGKKGRDKDS